MNPFTSPFSILILLVLIQTSTSTTSPHTNIVDDTCEKCTANNPNFNDTLCVNSSNSIPNHNSTLKSLAVIAIKIAKANARRIKSKLKMILKHKSRIQSTYVKSCLETCLELYSHSVWGLNDSVRSIRARRYDDANMMLSSVVDAPGSCDDGFSGGEVESPLKRWNDEFLGALGHGSWCHVYVTKSR